MLTSQVCMTLLKAVTEIILSNKGPLIPRVTVESLQIFFLILFIFEADPRRNTVDFK